MTRSDRNIPIHISKKSESLKLLQQIRDEAHRFAITFHRNQRNKNAISFELTQLKGIGKGTAILLLNHFKSLKKLKTANQEEIEKVIGKSKARIVIKGLQ